MTVRPIGRRLEVTFRTENNGAHTHDVVCQPPVDTMGGGPLQGAEERGANQVGLKPAGTRPGVGSKSNEAIKNLTKNMSYTSRPRAHGYWNAMRPDFKFVLRSDGRTVERGDLGE